MYTYCPSGKKNWPASAGNAKTQVQSLGVEDALEEEIKNPSANAGDIGLISGLGRSPLEKENATHSSILAWEISWTKEPGRLQPVGLQKS